MLFRSLVLHHHERLDGKGYPHRLAGDAIGLDTRIMTVCDVFDALITTRVYREAWPVERALSLLHSEAGEAFDLRVIEALERILRTDGLLAAAAPVVSGGGEGLAPGALPAAA